MSLFVKDALNTFCAKLVAPFFDPW